MQSKTVRSFRVGVVGATGAVGRQVLAILAERNFPLLELKLWASRKSAGQRLRVGKLESVVAVLPESSDPHIQRIQLKDCFSGLDLIFFTAGGKVSEVAVPCAAEVGVWCIDNSSVFRMGENIPLVIPEVNGDLLGERRWRAAKTIANPNCTTAQLVVVLNPILQKFGLGRVVVSSYQAVSGRGYQGVQELELQNTQQARGEPLTPSAFPHPIAGNCIPQIDTFKQESFTGEEWKVMQETAKILRRPNLRVAATCVRVSVVHGHSESVMIETEKATSPDELRELLGSAAGVVVQDDPARSLYPMAIDAAGKDPVFVGRIRRDLSAADPSRGFLLWIVADNLRKGAALNAVQIAETLREKGL